LTTHRDAEQARAAGFDDQEDVMGTNQRAQITMTEAEVTRFIVEGRTATMATNGPDGVPHLVAMWYGVLDGKIWFETKAKSQKAQNLRRDNRISAMIEDGLTYDALRGISIEGTAEIIDDPDTIWKVGVDVWERYNGPYTEEMKPFVEVMLHKRVVVRVDPERVRSWDHRKLGMDPMPLGGSTARFLNQ
jgi:PPOX class probable F420-dependent enzyme